jgi:hypothetical protein
MKEKEAGKSAFKFQLSHPLAERSWGHPFTSLKLFSHLEDGH